MPFLLGEVPDSKSAAGNVQADERGLAGPLRGPGPAGRGSMGHRLGHLSNQKDNNHNGLSTSNKFKIPELIIKKKKISIGHLWKMLENQLIILYFIYF